MSDKSKDLSVFKRPHEVSKLGIIRRKRKVKVLEEDEYVEKVEKIIERDFFPENDKLKARLEYIDAADRNDTTEMARLRERFSTGRLTRASTPSSNFSTPVPQAHKSEEDGQSSKETSSVVSEDKDDELKNVTLDKFLSNHTSEDNESFHDLMEDQRQEFERTHAWMFKKDEQLSIENKSEQLALPSIEDQCSEKKSLETKPLDGWTYKNVNAVFYHPEGAPLSDAEKIEWSKKQKMIVKENTRFKTNPWKLTEAAKANLIAAKKEADSGKVGADGKNLVDPNATPVVNGYKLLRLDNPTPLINPEESPFMTWGEVESTPYRLEGTDEDALPLSTAPGPSFKIQDMPKRDRIALELAEKNSKFYRDKKNKAIEKARGNVRTPQKGNLSLRAASMSPAALRLATNKLGIRIGTDKALKAAYTPSPMTKSVRGTPTPSKMSLGIKSTPKRSKNVESLAAASSTPSHEPEGSLTDNLLNLPNLGSSKSRPKASDYL